MRLLNLLLRSVGSLFFGLHFIIVMAILFIVSLIEYLWLTLLGKQKGSFNPLAKTHPDVFMDSMEMIKFDGFEITPYYFKTPDDYTVCLWRITNTRTPGSSRPYPVIIQHGLLDCSISWFLQFDKSKALPYMLSTAGYDVWVGNNRGTKYSMQEHKRPNYWSYSFDHLANHDVPTIINSVLKATNTDKVIYIGHSQGSTQLLACLTEQKDIADKIHSFLALGPVISLSDVQNHLVINLLSKLPLLQIYRALGFKTLLHLPPWMNRCIGILIYNTGIYFKSFFHIVNILCGYPESNKIDLNRFGVIIAHEPGGASLDNIMQWIQFAKSKQIRKYDYGKKKNLMIYNQEEPPAYDFSKLKQHIGFKTHLFRGTKDSVISEKDFQNLVGNLAEQSTEIYHLTDYAHLDYIWGNNADLILYDRILQILNAES